MRSPLRAKTLNSRGTPSFSEGFAVEDTLHPDRLVFGAESAWAMEQLYASFAPIVADRVPVVQADLPTAELVKVAAVSTRSSPPKSPSSTPWPSCATPPAPTSRCSRTLSASMTGSESASLQPGLGFGGGRLPKDIRAFRHRAELSLESARRCGSWTRWTRSTSGAARVLSTWCTSWSGSTCAGGPRRSAWRHLQAELRRRPRRTRP